MEKSVEAVEAVKLAEAVELVKSAKAAKSEKSAQFVPIRVIRGHPSRRCVILQKKLTLPRLAG